MTRPFPSLRFALVCLAFSCASANSIAQDTVRFLNDWRWEGPSAPLLMGLQTTFPQAKLNVKLTAGTGSGATVAKVAAGEFDMGLGDFGALVEHAAKNPNVAPPVAVYVLYERMPAAVFVRAGVSAPPQLAGKKIGAPAFDGGRKMWGLFADYAKIGAVQWQTVDAAQRETQFAKGQLDAITGFYFTSLLNIEAAGLRGHEYNVFPFYEYGVRLYGNVILVNPQFLQANPKVVERFVRAFHSSLKEAIRDTPAAVKYVKEMEPAVDERLEWRRARLAFDRFVRTPTVSQEGLGTIKMSRVSEGIALVVAGLKLPSTPKAESLARVDFLPSEAERKLP